MSLFSKRLQLVDTPAPVTFGSVELPDINVWRRNRDALSLAMEYVVNAAPEIALNDEAAVFTQEFAAAIWATEEDDEPEPGAMSSIRSSLEVAAVLGAAFAQLELSMDDCPPGKSLVWMPCALAFGPMLFSDEVPGAALPTLSYTLQSSYYLHRMPDRRADDVLPPAPLATGRYLGAGPEFNAIREALRAIWTQGS